MRRSEFPILSWSFIAASLLAGSLFADSVGGIRVTGADGTTPPGSVFSSRDQVYLAVGPDDAECAGQGLADGVYSFQVNDVSGTVGLSTDDPSNRTFTVTGGVIAVSAGNHVVSPDLSGCGSTLIQLQPFNRAPNGTGVYLLSIFCQSCIAIPEGPPVFVTSIAFAVRENIHCLETHCVSGTIFRDDNDNGTQDPGEPGLPGVVVAAASPGHATVYAQTGLDGTYSLCGLTETNYTISELVPAGYRQTAPAEKKQLSRYLFVGNFVYTLKFCNQNFADLNFGDFPLPGSISGMKFNDANGNGLLDAGEAGVAGVTINLHFAVGDVSGILATTVTDDSGNFSFANLVAGDYAIEEVVPSGYRQTTPAGNGIIAVPLAPGQNVQGLLFGNQLIPIVQFGAISGMKFNDLNGNGVLDPGEPGLAGVTINLQPSAGNPVTTTTDTAGNFSFQDLTPGTYTVSEVVPSGYRQTLPAAPGTIAVTVTAGNTSSNLLFGNQLIPITEEKGSISGFVFYDFNKNTIQDPTEKGLPGITMKLFNSSSQLVATTTTDDNGLFTFSDVPAGDYTVSPVPPDQFFQTVPPNKAPISVHVDPGEAVTGLVFALTC